MAFEMSYILMTPYTVKKSRTGGIISRLLSRTDLELIGVRILAFDNELCAQYATSLRKTVAPSNPDAAVLLSDYVLENFAPQDGKAERSMFLLFQGEDAAAKLTSITGAIAPQMNRKSGVGETIRDTYADYIVDKNDGSVKYFEPAVFTPAREDHEKLRIFADFMTRTPNIIDNAVGSQPGDERTLVLIKPDNWRHPSTRPGGIIDMFSRTGLRIVAAKLHRMSVEEALEFYSAVKGALRKKLSPLIGIRAREILEKEFELAMPDTEEQLTELVGQKYADEQFLKIVEFMSGQRPEESLNAQTQKVNNAKCLAMIYEGSNAIAKIRDVLGPTDPTKAPGGTIRRDFGSDVMINTAHASDSSESFNRETGIIRIANNSISDTIYKYLNK